MPTISSHHPRQFRLFFFLLLIYPALATLRPANTPDVILQPPGTPPNPILDLGVNPNDDTTPIHLATGDWVRLSHGESRTWLYRDKETDLVSGHTEYVDDQDDEDGVHSDSAQLNRLVQDGSSPNQADHPNPMDMVKSVFASKRHAKSTTSTSRLSIHKRRPTTYTSALAMTSSANSVSFLGTHINRTYIQLDILSPNTARFRTNDLAYLQVKSLPHHPQQLALVAGTWDPKHASVFSIVRVEDGRIKIGFNHSDSHTYWLTPSSSHRTTKPLERRGWRDWFSKSSHPSTLAPLAFSTPVLVKDEQGAEEDTSRLTWHVHPVPHVRHGYTESVSSVYFDLDNAKAKTSERQVVADLIFPNESNTTQQMQYSYQASLGITSSVSWMTIGMFETVNSVNLDFKPLLILTGSGSSQFKFSISRSKMTTETVQTQRQQTFTFSLAVPARRQVRASASAVFANADIPFVMTVARVLRRWDGTRLIPPELDTLVAVNITTAAGTVKQDKIPGAYRYHVRGVLKEENFAEQRYHIGQDEPIDLAKDPASVGTAVSTPTFTPSAPLAIPVNASASSNATVENNTVKNATESSVLLTKSTTAPATAAPPTQNIPQPSRVTPAIPNENQALYMDAQHTQELARGLGKSRHDFLTQDGHFGPLLRNMPTEFKFHRRKRR